MSRELKHTSLLSDDDLYLFNEGSHRHLGEKLGAHLIDPDGRLGAVFAVWAPNAVAVSVVGDFNGWRVGASPLTARASSGIWEGVDGSARPGEVYKFAITTPTGEVLQRADPFATFSEVPPKTGSVLWDLSYAWNDGEWMARRAAACALDAAMSIYEVHLGSWLRDPDRPGELLGYTELAPRLIAHVGQLGFTHVEFLPLMEHPYYGSWGYQVTGFFAPTSRYGTPQELMGLIEALHQAGIGVILDWVPSHFPSDEFALARFDGSHLFEHADPRRGTHPDWHSALFNYGRHEVRGFLISSAEHWLARYHADAIRVDGVASMLYLDYSRKPGEWTPNREGGREDLDAVEFLRELNTALYAEHPDIQVIAEESTAWPGVTRPVEYGGLGFGLKWDMGWMHDTLQYLAYDPVHRRYHHSELTMRGLWAFSEQFVLPLSHDEVVHQKGSLLAKMPGDHWQQLANMRLLLAYQATQPGKKLLFMGAEFAQVHEWNHEEGLDWGLLEDLAHAGVMALVADLNALYRDQPAMHELDTKPAGLAWIEVDDAADSTLSYLRFSASGDPLLVVCNFTPVPRYDRVLGLPRPGHWREVLNSDAVTYGGSGVGNLGGIDAEPTTWGYWPARAHLTLPPLGCIVLVPERGPAADGGGEAP